MASITSLKALSLKKPLSEVVGLRASHVNFGRMLLGS
jgi:hypothetical protein